MEDLLKNNSQVLTDIEDRISLRYFQEENAEMFDNEKKSANNTTPLEQARNFVAKMKM